VTDYLEQLHAATTTTELAKLVRAFGLQITANTQMVSTATQTAELVKRYETDARVVETYGSCLDAAKLYLQGRGY
jgi:Pyruvate/2-oxoacid:ferredoxin oxidoreductase gamma subunit